jgi:hypothetical protein
LAIAINKEIVKVPSIADPRIQLANNVRYFPSTLPDVRTHQLHLMDLGLFKNFSLANIGGGLTTTDRATDFTDRMDSASAQAVTTMGNSRLNEFRVQFARRHQFRTIGQAVAGPAITVTGVALFGGPRIGDGNSVGFDFNQKIWQAIDNYTWIAGSHAVKGGIDAQFIVPLKGQVQTTVEFYLATAPGEHHGIVEGHVENARPERDPARVRRGERERLYRVHAALEVLGQRAIGGSGVRGPRRKRIQQAVRHPERVMPEVKRS